MDKLPEPEFQCDKNWPRLCVGTQEMRLTSECKYQKTFGFLALLTSYRYLRNITYYKKNFLLTALIVPSFVLSSHFIASFHSYDPFLLAAERNNQAELNYINRYKTLYREAKTKGIEIPDHLIK